MTNKIVLILFFVQIPFVFSHEKCSEGELVVCKNPFSLNLCDENGDIIHEILCPMATPNCVNGTCIAAGGENVEKTIEVAPLIKEFKCNGNGYFPDPSDCHSYHYCNENGPFPFECPDGSVFNSLDIECRESDECWILKCIEPHKFITYQPNPRYYAYCSENLEPNVFACPPGEEFDGSECKFQCKTNGYFPGRGPQHYYYCHYVQTLAQQEMTCPETSIFDALNQICVEEKSSL